MAKSYLRKFALFLLGIVISQVVIYLFANRPVRCDGGQPGA
jgi:hypothetical protein